MVLREKKGIIFPSLITWQESEDIIYLTNALGNEEDRGLTLRARNPICRQCRAVVSDAVLLKGC